MKTYFILLLFSTQAFALQCFEDENPIISFNEDILKITSPRECLPIDEIIFKQVEDEYKKYYGDEVQVIGQVKGFSLKGSLKEITLANSILGMNPPKGWKAVAGSCETLLCSFEKLLNSKEAAKQLFNIHAKSGYYLSLDQRINFDDTDRLWSPKEIREMDAAISKLPTELRNLSPFKVIERMEGSSSGTAGHAVTGGRLSDAKVVMYNRGMRGLSKVSPYVSSSSPQETLIHEICHHYDYQGFYASNNKLTSSEQSNFGFGQLSGWTKEVASQGSDMWVADSNAQFVSSYAATDIKEDFAESCMNYILNPDLLKEKAPAKYAFMKDKVFKGKVFNDEIWSNPHKAWPALGAIFQEEELACRAKINECMSKITYNGEKFCEGAHCVSAEEVLVRNGCFFSYQRSRIAEIDKTLKSDELYCSNDGKEIIERNSDKLCEQTASEFTSVVGKISNLDFSSEVSRCQKIKNYTHECVRQKFLEDLNVAPWLKESAESFINKVMPDRMDAIANELNVIGTNKWLKACLSHASKIITMKSKYTEKVVFAYESKNKEFSMGYLGSVYQKVEPQDFNVPCSREMIKVLQDEGYKTPSEEKTTRIFNASVKDEITSFETDVLGKINEVALGCDTNVCKFKKVAELLQAWEAQEPERRKGFASIENATELVIKFR